MGAPLSVVAGETLPHTLVTEQVTVQLTPLLEGSLATVAVNCTVAPACTVAELCERETIMAGGGAE